MAAGHACWVAQLYRFDERFEQQRELIWKNADEIIEPKSHNRRVLQDQWDSFGRFIVERTYKNGRTHFSIDAKRMDEASEKGNSICIALQLHQQSIRSFGDLPPPHDG